MSDVTLSVGDSFTANPTIRPGYKKKPPYTLTPENSAVVKTAGKQITALSSGETAVNMTAETATKTFTDSINVQVKNIEYSGLASTRTASGIVIARKTSEIEVGEDYSCQAYVLSTVTAERPYPYAYADDNLVTWESSNSAVCRVKNGVMTGVAEGTATITAYDLTKTVSESFTVSVVPESHLAYTPEEILELSIADIDTTSTETTTVALQTILTNAHEDGYKKVVFPANQTYFVSPIYGTIVVPTQMIVDFNGCVIQIEESTMTQTGYCMIRLANCDHTEVQNATIYGERFLIDGTGKESCVSAQISGASKRSGFRNCTISRSPGFNSNFGNANRRVVGFPLSSIEAGGIGDDGQDIELDYSFRGKTFINISSVGGVDSLIGLGNMQGFGGYTYMSARVYDIFFYDSSKTFISSIKNCIQYYRYSKPSNAVFCRISYRWGSAPTSSDPDYHAIAHVYSMDMPDRCFFKNCVFEDNYSTAIAPNGGDSSTIDGCIFRRNGYRDPAAHIDWEDGRQNNKGHILRDCYFTLGGNVAAIGADGLVVHNNVFDGVGLGISSEVQNERVWLNQFIKTTCTITPKTDCVFSQNIGVSGSSYTLGSIADTNFAVREAENSFV